MIYSRIAATGSFLPERIITNAELAQQIDTDHEWIVSRTGIHARHIADAQEMTSDLACKAAELAFTQGNINRQEIDLIIVATTTADSLFPSTACIVQDKLGITNLCPAFDVQAVCAGFVYALSTADAYIRSRKACKALVIGAETMTRLLNWNDRRTCILFGDGAGAVILEASNKPGILRTKLAADGRHASMLTTPGQIRSGKIELSPFLHMDGQAVFKFAVKSLATIAEKTLEEAKVNCQDLDWLVPHQANIRIIESTAKHLKLPMEKVIVTVSHQANTSAASVPLALDTAIRDGRIKRGHNILLEGIGGGFTWGAILATY